MEPHHTPQAPVVIGGIVQHNEHTPVESLWLTPRRTRMLLALLRGPQNYDREALAYFLLVGLVKRAPEGKFELTDPRGRELAERISKCHPPLRGEHL